MGSQATGRSISSTTASTTWLLLRSAPLLLRPRKNRRKLGDSRPVDDLAIRVETRSVAGTVPGLLGLIPVHDAVEMGAYRRPLVEAAILIAVDGDLPPTAANHSAIARLDRIDRGSLATGEVVLVLFGDVGVFLHVLGSGAKA